MTSLFTRLWQCLNRLISGCKADEEICSTSNSSSPFDQLPDDVTNKILQKLFTSDRARMMSVCKSWRHMLMMMNFHNIPHVVATESPWRILSNDSYSKQQIFLKEIRFYSASEEKIYRFKLPKNITNSYGKVDKWCCCGSSRGWLIIAVGHDMHSTNMFLWNPVSGQTHKLPPLSTLPFFDKFVDDAVELGIKNMSCAIPCLQVSSTSVVDCVVAIVLINPKSMKPESQPYQHDMLALCTPHDKRWSTVVGGGKDKRIIYNDILFHNEKLYVFCEYDEEEHPLEVVDHDTIIREGRYMVHLTGGGGGCIDVEVDRLRFVFKHTIGATSVPDEGLRIGFSIYEREHTVGYLVESCSTGEFLVVSGIQDLCSYVDGHDDDQVEGGPVESFVFHQTRGFEVRRVDLAGDRLEKVSGGIGNHENIFLGGHDAFSHPATTSFTTNNNSQVAGDCIYFALSEATGIVGRPDDDEIYENWDRMYFVREQGVFNMQNNKIQITSLRNQPFNTGFVDGWFRPNLF